MSNSNWKIKNENGTFEGDDLYEVLKKSNSENSIKYTIYENGRFFDVVVRQTDSQGKIIRDIPPTN
jgi:tRNA A22 N-methylase